MNDYDYLIRLAKWNDHKATWKQQSLLEKGRDIAEKEDNRTLKNGLILIWVILWSLAESRIIWQLLKTLAIDPNYSYALKGIAWIVFSHERNTKEGIVEAITHNTQIFIYWNLRLLNLKAMRQHKNAYFAICLKNNYGRIINNTLIYADAKKQHLSKKSQKIEVDHRPTRFLWFISLVLFEYGTKALKLPRNMW
jgi:hypothetical protein